MNPAENLFVGSVFVAGLLSFFSPCVLPVLPVYFGILTDADTTTGRTPRRSRALVRMAVFLAGLSVVFVLLGYGAGALGSVLQHPVTTYVMGAVVILLGLHQMEVLSFRALQRQKTWGQQANQRSLFGVFVLGLSFSFGWTPCVGPVLSSVLAIAATQSGGAWHGAWLMFVYTLGLAIPFAILAILSDWAISRLRVLHRHTVWLKKIGGAMIVVIGICLILGQLNWLTTLLGA